MPNAQEDTANCATRVISIEATLNALRKELSKGKTHKRVRDRIQQISSSLVHLKSDTPLTQSFSELNGALRNPFLLLYETLPSLSFQLSAAIFSEIHITKVLPMIENADEKARESWETLQLDILSGVIDFLDKHNNVRSQEAVAEAFYPFLCDTYFPISGNGPMTSARLLNLIHTVLSETVKSNCRNQHKLRNPRILGGKRIGITFSRYRDFYAMESLLSLFALILPSTKEKSGRVKRTKFVREVFVSSQAFPQAEELARVFESVTVWDDTAAKLFEIIAKSNIDFPQPFVYNEFCVCGSVFPRPTSSDRLNWDRYVIFANVPEEEGTYSDLQVPYSSILKIEIAEETGAPITKVALTLSSPPLLSGATMELLRDQKLEICFDIQTCDMKHFLEVLQNRGLGDHISLARIPRRAERISLLASPACLEFASEPNDPAPSYDAKVDNVQRLLNSDDAQSEDALALPADMVFPQAVSHLSTRTQITRPTTRSTSGKTPLTSTPKLVTLPALKKSNTPLLKRTISQIKRDPIFGGSIDDLSDPSDIESFGKPASMEQISSQTAIFVRPDQQQTANNAIRRRTILDSDDEIPPAISSSSKAGRLGRQVIYVSDDDNDDSGYVSVKEMTKNAHGTELINNLNESNLLSAFQASPHIDRPRSALGGKLTTIQQENTGLAFSTPRKRLVTPKTDAHHESAGRQSGTVNRSRVAHSTAVPSPLQDHLLTSVMPGKARSILQHIGSKNDKENEHHPKEIQNPSVIVSHTKTEVSNTKAVRRAIEKKETREHVSSVKRKRIETEQEDADDNPRRTKQPRILASDLGSENAHTLASQVFAGSSTHKRTTKRYRKPGRTSSPTPTAGTTNFDEVPGHHAPDATLRLPVSKSAKLGKRAKGEVTRVSEMKPKNGHEPVGPGSVPVKHPDTSKPRPKPKAKAKTMKPSDHPAVVPNEDTPQSHIHQRPEKEPRKMEDDTLMMMTEAGDSGKSASNTLSPIVAWVEPTPGPPNQRKEKQAPWDSPDFLKKIQDTKPKKAESIIADVQQIDLVDDVVVNDLDSEPMAIIAVNSPSDLPVTALPSKEIVTIDLTGDTTPVITKTKTNPHPIRPPSVGNEDIRKTSYHIARSPSNKTETAKNAVSAPGVTEQVRRPKHTVTFAPAVKTEQIPAVIQFQENSFARDVFQSPISETEGDREFRPTRIRDARRPKSPRNQVRAAKVIDTHDGAADVINVLNDIHKVIVDRVCQRFADVKNHSRAGRQRILQEAASDLCKMHAESVYHFNTLIDLEREYSAHARKLIDGFEEVAKTGQSVCDFLDNKIRDHDRNNFTKKLPGSVFISSLPAVFDSTTLDVVL